MNRLFDFFGGNYLIRDIDHQKATAFLAAQRRYCGAPAKSLNPWSIHRIWRNCRTIFNAAVADGICVKNPFIGIKTPKCNASQWYYLKEAEFLGLLNATPTLVEKVFYSLCYLCGLRLTEALTVRWCDIDFEKSTISIRSQAAGKFPPFLVKDSDMRTIPMPRYLINLLTLLQAETSGDSPYVVTNGERLQVVLKRWQACQATGQMWSYRHWANNIPRNFNRRVRQAGIDTAGRKLSVHTLRKCCIQNWLNFLPMNYVKAFAGHSDITTTEKFYTTVDMGRFAEFAATIDRRLTDAKINLTDEKLTISGKNEAIYDKTGLKTELQDVVNKEVMSSTAGVIQR